MAENDGSAPVIRVMVTAGAPGQDGCHGTFGMINVKKNNGENSLGTFIVFL